MIRSQKPASPLKKAMQEKNIKPIELAEVLRVTLASVYNWMSGRTVPYVRTRDEITIIVGVNTEILWPKPEGEQHD